MKKSWVFNLSLIIVLFLLINCEKDFAPITIVDTNNNGVVHKLTFYDNVKFRIKNFQIEIDSSGAIHDGTLYNLSTPVGLNDDYIRIIYFAGLWVGAFINGEAHANINWVGTYPLGNFIAKCDSIRTGVFFVDPGKLIKNDYSILIPFGFPTDQSGKPRLLGDAMCWSALETDLLDTLGLFQSPVPNLHVSQAVYGYINNNLDQIFFVRYEIENRASFKYDEVYVGFYSDTDLLYYDNATGYDSSRSLSYTYSPRDSIFYPSPSYVTGFTFLETPLENGTQVGIGSHRIMRKNNYLNYEFGERGFDTPEQVLFALKGLSNFGDPMINPVTGNITKFAFTGDPIAQTGWLDSIPIDVRSLLSSAPFTLAAGEKKIVTIVWVVEQGQNLSAALSNLKNKVDYIRNRDDLWKF
jgi:hypothetical protein